ncbi:hypothetical protein B0T26DRAFT_214398 [Lasiosphaeria miniovina]|uniref:Uncharacterized protein n=1 Tax=Lasiosphaeria miniovina TaxID=1954250 RepID=A0AA40AUS0_9PEZI|nr:uncharacterized protein B0T26DRAFT_214398 [Lasiosphaeria miniovina]KAK0722351.1 hypothetical protein B0T26DRAFT_214398 [Lasiosphaeria miniovina]
MYRVCTYSTMYSGRYTLASVVCHETCNLRECKYVQHSVSGKRPRRRPVPLVHPIFSTPQTPHEAAGTQPAALFEGWWSSNHGSSEQAFDLGGSWPGTPRIHKMHRGRWYEFHAACRLRCESAQCDFDHGREVWRHFSTENSSIRWWGGELPSRGCPGTPASGLDWRSSETPHTWLAALMAPGGCITQIRTTTSGSLPKVSVQNRLGTGHERARQV